MSFISVDISNIADTIWFFSCGELWVLVNWGYGNIIRSHWISTITSLIPLDIIQEQSLPNSNKCCIITIKKKTPHGSKQKVELKFCDENSLKSFENFPSRGIHLCFSGQCQFKGSGAVIIVPSHTKKIFDLFEFG